MISKDKLLENLKEWEEELERAEEDFILSLFHLERDAKKHTIQAVINIIESGSFDLPPGAEYNKALDDVLKALQAMKGNDYYSAWLDSDVMECLIDIEEEIESLRKPSEAATDCLACAKYRKSCNPSDTEVFYSSEYCPNFITAKIESNPEKLTVEEKLQGLEDFSHLLDDLTPEQIEAFSESIERKPTVDAEEKNPTVTQLILWHLKDYKCSASDDIKDMARTELELLECDGLHCDDCGCFLDDLMPCVEFCPDNCRAGYKRLFKDPNDGRIIWGIGPEKMEFSEADLAEHPSLAKIESSPVEGEEAIEE